MNRCILVFCTLFIPIICSNNTTLTKTENAYNKTTITNHTAKEMSNIKIRPIMVSEGGSQLLNNRTMILPKDSEFIDLETVDKEIITTKLKPVQARKGVGNPLGETIQHDNRTTVPIEVNEGKTLPGQSQKELNSYGNNSNIVHLTSQDIVNNLTVINTPAHINSNEVHKKPLLLSFETLDKNNKNTNKLGSIPSVKSSLDPLISDQIPSPNRDVKSYKMATKHPGLVTPVIITILVVPVFALLGYMAFKRGQEAWKNRHYKRMDFLLDGMYNE